MNDYSTGGMETNHGTDSLLEGWKLIIDLITPLDGTDYSPGGIENNHGTDYSTGWMETNH